MSTPISRSEWAWVGGVLALALLLSSLPYLSGYASQTPEQVFSGAVFDRMDYAVHLATMHLGERGEWAYRMRMTGEEQSGAYIKLAYIFLGHAARWTGLSLPTAYQLGRLAAGALAGLAVYLLAAQLFAERLWRRMAFLLAFFGSGLGWLQLILGALPQAGISPVDFWLMDAYLFFGLMIFPHFSWVTALLAGMVAAYLSFLRRPAAWKLALAALLGVLIQPVQPFAPLLGDLALAGAWAGFSQQRRKFSWGSLGPLLVVGLAQAPLLLYHWQALAGDPAWQGFSGQNVTASPPFSYYLWGFGLFWPLALVGAWFVARRWIRPEAEARGPADCETVGAGAALAWCAGALFLAYLPLVLQRRFMMAYTLPLALLAVYGLKAVLKTSARRVKASGFLAKPGPLVLAFVLLASLSSFYLVSGYCLVLAARPAEYFDPGELVQAVDWLAAGAGPEELVFSAEETGRLVAARAGLPVYLGHPIETLNYAEKTRLASGFFSGVEGSGLLQEAGVRWVLFGPYERALAGQAADRWRASAGLAASPGALREVYHNGSVSIFRFEP